jgi:hypothetical protein
LSVLLMRLAKTRENCYILRCVMRRRVLKKGREDTFSEESLIRNMESVDLRNRSKPKSSFNDILLSAIDEALSSLGENVAASIYFHLEKTFGIKRLEIPQRVKEFSDALEKIFGLGARTIEILCMKKFHEKMGVTCKWPEYEWPLCKWVAPEMVFQEYVDLMRQNYEKARKGKSQTRNPIK